MELRIVNAAPRHLEALEALEKRCFSLPWTEEMLLSQLPDDSHEFLAAESDSGELLGYVGMMCVLDEGYIANVAVSPEYRRQGIGDLLIEKLLERAALRELSFVTLEVREHNEPAIALYRKHGFSPVGLRKNYYEAPVENAVLMTKYLK
jgi:ribosomal-protein-alanine N-acetyltransferase